MKVYRKVECRERKKVLQIIKVFFKKKKFVEECLVFGSFIKRRYYRDIDIALVVRKRVGENVLNEIATDLEGKLGVEVDVKIFNDMPDAVKFEVLKHGRPLFKNEKFRHYRYEFVKRYIDFVEWWKKWI